MVDTTLEISKVSDEATYQRDGTIARNRVYVFYLGKFGPFTEKVPLTDPFNEAEFPTRVAKLRAHLANIHL